MSVDLLSLYETLDSTSLVIPPRSRLYCLEPIGVGTLYAESLTSYTSRLAEAHSVLTKVLVEREILPVFARSYLSGSHGSCFWKSAQSVNGTLLWAKEWVGILEKVTHRRDLRHLTMLSWAAVLPPRGLLRRSLAWCPACYEDWRRTDQVIYEPLLWALEVVTVSPQYSQLLYIQCPYCQAERPVLTPIFRSGYCSYCGRWLGMSTEAILAASDPPAQEEVIRQRQVTTSVGELLTAAPTLVSLPQRRRIAEAITVWVEQVGQGYARRLACKIGFAEETVRAWYRGWQIPCLDMLLLLCYRLGISPLQFLTEEPMAMSALGIAMPAPRPQYWRPTYRPFDRAKLKAKLEAVLSSEEVPPLYMSEVARRLGQDHSHLLKHFRELCRAIAARAQAYRKNHAEQSIQRICNEVGEATRRIHDQGLYPSLGRVRARLSKPGYMRLPEARTTWHETLRELEW